VPTPTVFNSFKEAVAEKVHNLGSDTLKVMLTNVAPVAGNSVKANLTEIAAGNGYTAGGSTITLVSSAQSGGTYQLALAALSFTASGGTMATFRYVVLYNDTATNDELICFYDIGAGVSLTTGVAYTINASTWLSNA
jgi:hypothetical protein